MRFKSMKTTYFVIGVLLVAACQNTDEPDLDDSQSSDEENVEWVDINSIQAGPILHEELSEEQIAKIDYLHETFKEVDPTSREKWIEDFQRDLNPDSEIEIWMMMAEAYSSFCNDKELSLDEKQEAYQVVLLRSAMSETEVLENVELEYLWETDVLEIMAGYKLEADPIEVIE